MDSFNRFEGQAVEFTCTATEEISSVQWIVNGSALDPSLDNSISTVVSFAGGTLIIRNVPLHYSGTTAQCVVTFLDNTTLSSNTATLQVQGNDH